MSNPMTFLRIGAALLVSALCLHQAQVTSPAFAKPAAPSRSFLPHIVKAPPAPCSVAPILLSPFDNASINTLLPDLTYSIGETPPYSFTRIEVATSAAMTPLVRIGPVAPFGENLEPGRKHYWRVVPICFTESGQTLRGTSSWVWTFTTPATVTYPGTPTLISPQPNEEVRFSATFTWNGVGLTGIEYRVLVRRVDNLQVVSMSRVFEQTIAFSGLLPASTEFEWSVQARNDQAYGARSEWRRFRTQ